LFAGGVLGARRVDAAAEPGPGARTGDHRSSRCRC
jgi:hypothetical protein